MLPTGLSMLWENLDPTVALRGRFGFADFDVAVDWMAALLDEVWDIEVELGQRVVISGRHAIAWVETDRGPLVVKWSNEPDQFDDLAKAARLLQWLDGRGLPVAAPLPTLDGRVRVIHDGPQAPLSVSVLPEKSGDWLDVSDDAAVRAAGACLAELQQALQIHSADQAPPTGIDSGRRTRITRWLADHDQGWAPAASATLRTMTDALPEADAELQLVHNDFRSANLLTRDSEITAVLDFDALTWDDPVNELARASVFLGTRFTDWRPTPPAARAQFRAGYESVRPLGPAEDAWFDALVLWHGLAAIPAVQDPGGWAEALMR